MNRNRDFDETIASWLDEGADRAPERYVWAVLEDVERTAQRGAWMASLEEFLMHLKPAAPVLGVVAVVVLAIAAYQAFGTPNVGDAEPRVYTTEDLPNIIFTEATLPDGATLGETRSGRTVVGQPMRPGGVVVDFSTVVSALAADAEFPDVGIYTTWSVLFETPADAEQAFGVIAAEHDAEDGWDVGASRTDPNLGDESAAWTGPLYELAGESETILWRKGNLLLAAVGWGDADVARLRSIADGMDGRAD
jgi:hypothetical protein